MSVYDFKVTDIDGNLIDFNDYRGKVLLIVNTASKCGFTPQFRGLEELYGKYKGQGFEILGFPCNQFMNQDPGDEKEIKNFCLINYGVSFRMFEKILVNGKNAHPLYKFLKEQMGGVFNDEIKWNFTKFLVDKDGNVTGRFASNTNPRDLEEVILQELKK